MAFLYVAFSESVVEASYRGTSLGILNQIVARHRSRAPDRHDLAFYQHKRTTFFIEISLIFVLCESHLILEVRRNRLLHTLKEAIANFFTSAEHPVNLAVFRIVFFGFWGAWWLEPDRVLWFSQLPRELQVPPIGFGWFLSNAPTFDPAVITILGWILRATCFTAMIGLFTGPSAFVVTVLGFVLYGIAQSYGKVDGHNYMIWFAALLAVSRSADMLSVDAMIRAVRRADSGAVERPAASRTYAFPLRLIWTLMGIYYFFGGMWKVIDGRWRWIFSESLRNYIYTRWYYLHRIPPQFVIYQHAWFFRLGAVITIGFELSFIALVLFPRGRAFAIAIGLFFHNSLALLMRNWFLDLQMCYVSLVNWHGIFRWLGKQCFREPLYVVYDDGCWACRRTVSWLQVFDVLDRITYVGATFEEMIRQDQSNRLDQITVLHDMHTAIGDRTRRGYSVYLPIAKRVPLLWFVYPVLFLWPIHMLGKRIYSRAIYSTRCNMECSKTISTAANLANPSERAAAPRILTLVGVTLIGTNTACGLLHVHGWPFTGGPAFSTISPPEIRTFAVERIDRTGNTAIYNPIRPSATRLAGIYNNIYGHPGKPELRTAFCKFLRKSVPGWNDAASIRFYAERVSVVPTEQSKNPLERHLVFECEQ
jgi:hypothetical protein